MMKSKSTWGTPVNSISGNQGEGFMKGPLVPPRNDGTTTLPQFKGEQATNRENGATGTPYQSRSVNDDREPPLNRQKYGIVLGENGQNMSDPSSNGNGVLFDGVSPARDLLPTAANVMDSPVPMGAQQPIPNTTEVLANLRSGEGKTWGPKDGPGNNFQEMDGVMSRGMVGTSKASRPETELTSDDTLKASR
jgi:hypothetical protein